MRPLRFDAASPSDQREAASRLNAGRLVALPTETVYGLAARSDVKDAVARVYEAKQRPRNKALPVLVSGLEQATTLWDKSTDWEIVRALATAFWPGPLTIVSSARPDLPDWLIGDDGTLALRCPNQPETLAILSMLSAPVVCPSANHSDDPSPTSADAVESSLADRVDAIVETRLPIGGMESTIVSVRSAEVHILRAGALSRADIEGVVIGTRVIPPDGAEQGSARSGSGAQVFVGTTEEAPSGALLLEASTLEEAFSKVHSFLAAIPKETRVEMGFAISERFENEPRVDSLRRVLGRYLGA